MPDRTTRRRILSTVAASSAVAISGCVRNSSSLGSPRETTDQAGGSSQDRSDTSAEDSPAIPLPGEPSRTQSGALNVQSVSAGFDSASQGFDQSADQYDFDTQPQASFDSSEVSADQNENSVHLEVAADHVGTGQATGIASGSFQTAWEAPADGRYQISTTYTRFADILYNRPDRGSISAAFDTSLLALNHDTGDVVTRRTQPALRHKLGRLRREVAEWALEKAVTYLVSTYFGLGLVARVVLGAIIDELIDLGQSTGRRQSEIYDIYHRVEPNRDDPSQVSLEFEASEGDVFVFELAPTLEFIFEITGSWWYQPTAVGENTCRSFQIRQV